MEQASYWESQDSSLHCLLCPHGCLIHPGGAGLCRVRKNDAGVLKSMNYAQVASLALDPIEKKPLRLFYPGHTILSAGSWGCNLRCSFCQNWEISQGEPLVQRIDPDSMAEMAKKQGINCIGVAYTYSEPVIWFEYVLATATAVKAAGLKNVLVTNGYIRQEPLLALLPWIDAMNIDVKAFNDEFYSKICGGRLEPVKAAVEIAVQYCHVEVTTLLISGLNDKREEIEALAAWLAQIDPDIPLHISRYFPRYQMTLPATPIDTMRRAQDTARKYLKYVFLGNV